MNYKIKSRIWIEVGNNVLLGEGRVRLLKAIEKTKKEMVKAAKELNFLEAGRLRDEMYALQKVLDSKSNSKNL